MLGNEAPSRPGRELALELFVFIRKTLPPFRRVAARRLRASRRAPSDWVNRVPDGMTPLEAITIGVAGYTAALAVNLCELNGLHPERGKVLVNRGHRRRGRNRDRSACAT